MSKLRTRPNLIPSSLGGRLRQPADAEVVCVETHARRDGTRTRRDDTRTRCGRLIRGGKQPRKGGFGRKQPRTGSPGDDEESESDSDSDSGSESESDSEPHETGERGGRARRGGKSPTALDRLRGRVRRQQSQESDDEEADGTDDEYEPDGTDNSDNDQEPHGTNDTGEDEPHDSREQGH